MMMATNEVYGQCPECATEPSCDIKNKNDVIQIYEILKLDCVVPVDQNNTSVTLSILDINKKPYFVYDIVPDLTGFFKFKYRLCDQNQVTGIHYVSANYLGSSGIFPFTFVQQYENPKNDVKCGIIFKEPIPNWIRNNVEWWTNDLIDDITFVQGIQFLIKEEIMSVSFLHNTSCPLDIKSNNIIEIKNNAFLWSQKLISDNEFLKNMQCLP